MLSQGLGVRSNLILLESKRPTSGPAPCPSEEQLLAAQYPFVELVPPARKLIHLLEIQRRTCEKWPVLCRRTSDVDNDNSPGCPAANCAHWPDTGEPVKPDEMDWSR
jgi:hypothetical protein